MYNKVTEADVSQLRQLTAEKRVIEFDRISDDYSHDEMNGIRHMPDVLVKVKTIEEVAAVMKYATARILPVVVRGSGTGLVGAAVAIDGGIMLETAGMNKIIELDRDNLTLTVQPGVLLMDIAAYAEASGFMYPPDPGEKSATIGGNIATNAGGMRAVKYGVTRDYVRGLTVVLADGSVEQLGGKVVKNSSGYALKDLIIGSEGTLAIITEAVLKLVPLPKLTVSLLVPFADMESALQTVPLIIRSGYNPTAVEYFSRETILFAEDYLGKKFPDSSHPAYLLLTADGSDERAVSDACDRLSQLCLDSGAIDVYTVDTDERKASVWTARGAFLEAIKASTTEMDECDVVVPRRVIADFIQYTRQLADQYNIRIPSFGHAGDGNLHIYICRDNLAEKEWQDKLAAVFKDLYSRARQAGGQVSGEHGIGFAKKEYLHDSLGAGQIELMKGIKKAFDPLNILNPGKVCE